ncbi:zinc ribbon domain-containing protein [Paludisphaera mucosa]|uniref:Zinc ribbon domain-containing protein n=1 Tax=Paludisphaera mucosa TaxID=3030827 RepID=A0ABT6FI41_9BACT|nr:zinc ribbon domain-containing protein [Paludisphaera mucosa]MDG3007184.1 zinc ribbon domain-containing protein [Paludisphaera mucosa]
MKPPLPVRNIPPERKALFYAGLAVGLVGALLFASTFYSFAANFGDFDDFAGRARSMMFRAFGGMGLMIGGGVVLGVAARGLAGAGLHLDPEQARRDLEPWARMRGGLLGDVLDEIPAVQQVVDRLGSGERTVEVVRVRCPACKALNDEAARFCGQCGKPL